MTTALPPSLRETWQPLGTKTTSGRVLMLTVNTETTVYEQRDEPFSEHEQNEIPVRSLFTIDVSFRPPLATVGVTPKAVFSMAASKAVNRFLKQVETYGLRIGDQRKQTTYERADGTAGRWTVVDAAYPVDTDDGDHTIPVETHVGIWPTTTAYAMAGGTVPLEGFDALEVDPDRDRHVIGELLQTGGSADTEDDDSEAAGEMSTAAESNEENSPDATAAFDPSLEDR